MAGLKRAKKPLEMLRRRIRSRQQITPAEQLEALLEAASLSEVERSAWCRARGLFVHHLQQFKHQLSAPSGVQAQALRDAKRREEKLERDIRREDKALAEAAALLVLQKKFQSLLAEGEAE